MVRPRQDATAKAKGGPLPWQLTVYDRQAKIARTVGELTLYGQPKLSLDGTRLAVVPAENSHASAKEPLHEL